MGINNELHAEVFISFKNSDGAGRQTRDAELARSLHEVLMGKGIQTFFSNSTLLTLGQSVYKRAIDEALESTKILVVIATCEEYLNSEWVRYEWESFHQDILSGMKQNSQIVPYLGSISRERTPRSLRDFQTFNTEAHSVDDVAAFVEKALHAARGSGSVQQTFSGTEEMTARRSVATKKVRQSLYSSDSDQEYDRLMIQAKNTHDCDMAVLNKVIARIDRKPIWILDLGCAYNYVGNMRFGNMDNVRVVGVDISDKCLEFAAKNSDPEKFSFFHIDLEDPYFEYNLREVMDGLGIRKFDVMFGALLLLHLKKPVTVLKRLRRFLADDGYIVLRGSDDGSVLALNDDGLIRKIVDKCNTTVGFSDRQNGRKLYNQLVSAGYNHVQLETFIKDTCNKTIDERDELFFERFSYRINNFNKIMRADPTNEAKRNDYLFMKYALEELEEMFTNHDFWYCEHDFIAYARPR